MTATSTEAGLICTFYLDGQCYGVDVAHVQEVVRHQEMTAVPLASPSVGGLINLRGQIVAAIEMRHRFGLPVRPAAKLPMNVVIQSDLSAISLLVDEIGDVIDVTNIPFERPPDSTGSAKGLVERVYKLDNQLLFVIDVNRTVREEPAHSEGTSHA